MFAKDSIDKNFENKTFECSQKIHKIEKKIKHAVTEIRRLNGFMKS